MLEKNQHETDKDRYIALLSKFTGINKTQLKDYFKDHSVNTIFEHPESLKMNEKQLEKVKALMELKGLYQNLKENQDGYAMTSSDKVGNYFKNYFPELKDKEYVACSYLDTKLQIIKTEFIHEGTVNQSMLVPREVAKNALKYDSSAIMLSHNHPSGIPDPSIADVQTTKRVIKALEPLDIRLIDHVIIGDQGRSISLMQEGFINEINEYQEKYEPQVEENQAIKEAILAGRGSIPEGWEAMDSREKFKEELEELLSEDDTMAYGNEDEVIYKIDDITVYGGFDLGVRGVDHNILISDDNSWENIIEWGTVVVPETKTYISDQPISQFEDLGFNNLPKNDNQYVETKKEVEPEDDINDRRTKQLQQWREMAGRER